MSVKLDIFYTTKGGYEGHAQMESESFATFSVDISALEAQVVASGGTPRFKPAGGNLDKSPGRAQADPMMAAATAVFGAVPSCKNGCKTPMKHVNAGISKTSNRPYPAFYACPTCEWKVNA